MHSNNGSQSSQNFVKNGPFSTRSLEGRGGCNNPGLLLIKNYCWNIVANTFHEKLDISQKSMVIYSINQLQKGWENIILHNPI